MKYYEIYLERKERWKIAGLWKRMARNADNLSYSKDTHKTEIGGAGGRKKKVPDRQLRRCRHTYAGRMTSLKIDNTGKSTLGNSSSLYCKLAEY